MPSCGHIAAGECFDGAERIIKRFMMECGVPMAILLVIEPKGRFGSRGKDIHRGIGGERNPAAVLQFRPEGDVAQMELGGSGM